MNFSFPLYHIGFVYKHVLINLNKNFLVSLYSKWGIAFLIIIIGLYLIPKPSHLVCDEWIKTNIHPAFGL